MLFGHEALARLIAPVDAPTIIYRAQHPIPLATLERVLRGASGSMESLISKITWHLVWLPYEHSVQCFNLLQHVRPFLASRNLPAYVEEHERLVQSKVYWKGLFSRLQRVTNEPLLVRNGAAGGVFFSIFMELVDVGDKIVPDLYKRHVESMVEADLFGVLDDVIPLLSGRSEIRNQSEFGDP